MSVCATIYINKCSQRISACLSTLNGSWSACVFVCLFIDIGIGIGFRLWLFNQPWLAALTQYIVHVCLCVCASSSSFTNFTVQLGTSGSKAISCKGSTAFTFLFILLWYAVPKTTTTTTSAAKYFAEPICVRFTGNILIPIKSSCIWRDTHKLWHEMESCNFREQPKHKQHHYYKAFLILEICIAQNNLKQFALER